ncbi:MAG: hypothetical protein IPO78_17380 [Saprospiraceae bacterium]|nr:hypothetical protein [Saprospiraceae bacterium]
MKNDNHVEIQATKEVTIAKTAIEKLFHIRQHYEIAISTFKPKIEKLLSMKPSAEMKDNALKGIKAINEQIDTLKEARLVETRKIDEVKSLFTNYEKQLAELKSSAQSFADRCLEVQMQQEKIRQAEVAKENAKTNEIIAFRNTCRDYLLQAIADVRTELARLVMFEMDNHAIEFGEADLVEKIKAIEMPKLVNKIPFFTFRENLDVSEQQKKDLYSEAFTALKKEREQLKEETELMIQESIATVPSFMKSLKKDALATKQQLEAQTTLKIAEAQNDLQEQKNDNAISDTLDMIDNTPIEIVVPMKQVIEAEIVAHTAGLSLSKWYFMQPEYQKKPLDSLEKVSLGMMLTAAKKQYEKDNEFELNGVEFSVKHKAK